MANKQLLHPLKIICQSDFTNKLKRKIVLDKFMDQIEALYK